MKKATHDGECQLCGHKQKLPSNNLSLHGYTKRWGFFNGTCPGSRHLPYELSCDLLPPRLVWTKNEIANLDSMIADLRKPATTTKAWVSLYARDERTGRGHTRWLQADIYKAPLRDGDEYLFTWFDSEQGKRHEFKSDYTVQLHKMDPLDIATYANGKRADFLGVMRSELVKYADWCEGRIKSWTLRPLAETPPPKPPSIPMARLYVSTGKGRKLHPEPIPASMADAAIIELAASQANVDLSGFEVSRVYGFMGRIKTEITVRPRKTPIPS